MKRKIIAVAKKDISKGEEIIFTLDDKKWKSEELRLYKQGSKFLYRLIRSKLNKLKSKLK